MHPIIYTYHALFKRKIQRPEFLAYKRLFGNNRDPEYIKKCLSTFKGNEDKLKKLLWNQKMFLLEKKYKNVSFQNISLQTPNVMVIVEPRKHKHLKAVLKNMVYHLPKWHLHIFHGNNNEHFILKILGRNHNVKLTNLKVDNLDIPAYNNLLTSSSFWKQIIGDKVLIFQTDVLLRKSNIKPFLKYDYIGSPWDVENPCVSITNTQVGNGGFSLRSRDKMVKICESYERQNMNEDVFFSYHCQDMQYILPELNAATKFGIGQENIGKNPLGLHKTYNNPYLRIDDMKELLDF